MKKLLFFLSFLISLACSAQVTIVNQHITTIKKNGVVLQSTSRTDSTVAAADTVKTTIVKDSLVYRDTCLPSQPVNKVPTASAGQDQTIQLPMSNVTLAGSGSDQDGTIAGYTWTKVSGPTAGTLTNTTTPTLAATGLAQGVYTFRLTVMDDKGATGSDDVNVTVAAAASTGDPTLSGYGLLYNFKFDNGGEPLVKQAISEHGQINNGSIKQINGEWVFDALATIFQAQSSDYVRSEIQFQTGNSSDTSSYTPTEGAWEYDFTPITIPNLNGLSGQFHGYKSGTSGQGGGWIVGGKNYEIVEQVDNSTNFYGPVIYTFTPGVTYTIRHEVKFSTGKDGYWRVYIAPKTASTTSQNLPLVYNRANVQTCDGGGQYFKLGIYFYGSGTVPSNTKAEAYFDNVHIFKKL